MTEVETVHQLARRAPADGQRAEHWVWARCGLRATVRPGERMPPVFSGAAGNVTCPACLDPPSWSDAGIPG